MRQVGRLGDDGRDAFIKPDQDFSFCFADYFDFEVKVSLI